MANTRRPLTPYASVRHFFGAELRRRRDDAGLSAQSLAAIVHYSADQIEAIEKAQRWPKADLVDALDRALDANGALLQLLPLVEAERVQSAASGASAASWLLAVVSGLRGLEG